MAYIDEESYQEMITALTNFKKQIETQCEIMEQAGKDCLDNMEEDQYAIDTNASLGLSINKIRENYVTIDKVIKYLEEQLEKARKLRQKQEANG